MTDRFTEVKKYKDINRKLNEDIKPTCYTNQNDPNIPEGFKHSDKWWTKQNVTKYDEEADYYFNSYAHFGIHEEMIKDSVRTNAYRDAIIQNPDLFKDKVVLDVGCGTSILSMFCVKAGAKYVYAVDFSDIAHQAKKIVELNNMSDKIQVIKSKVEDIKELPGPHKKVDIIVSEWMGYFLVYESMLDSVLVARDRFLVKDGLMFPDQAIVYLGAIQDHEYYDSKINFWTKVYDFDMSCIKPIALGDPLIDCVTKDNMISDSCKLLDIDLRRVKVSELDYVAKWKLNIKRKEKMHAFVSWFDCYFNATKNRICLSTSPYSRYTHWKQTILYTPKPAMVFNGDVVWGYFAAHKNSVNPREIDIRMSVNLENSKEKVENEVLNFRVR